MKFSILGPGGIAEKMAAAVKGLEGVEAYAVASRNYDRARAFAKEWGFEKAYGSYEEMLEDPQTELVYVATPHSHHYQYAKMCLEHGKHVLVEKSFTVNAMQAEELIRISEEKHLLLAEAIWTRYMPSRKIIDDLLKSNMIGKTTSLTANLGYPLGYVERMQNPQLAGGALLDLGVYTLNFALMVFDGAIKEVHSSAVMSPEGIDWMDSITLVFEDGRVADLHSNMLAATNREGAVFGEKGYLEVQNINNCEEIRVYNEDHQLQAHYPIPEQINGYEYEVLACVKAIREGKYECPEMPHDEILRVMRLMDQIREIWGMKYPMECR
ncbi:MAG: Gfo/Idh/MocA family oxidoreductase [Lachnospiraceae bacterium]|nr:Gfo/Idh/MocA family oxidoreductase [Lachnospiraceae bacterium]